MTSFNSSISSLLIIAANYPAPGAPTYGTFVREFVRSMAHQGVQCTVISPVAIHKAHEQTFPYREEEKPLTPEDGHPIKIFRPRFISASAMSLPKFLNRLNPTRLTLRNFEGAVRKTIKKEKLQFDVIYGHFLYFGGATAVKIGSDLKTPSFPCVGEGELWTVDRFGDRVASQDLANASGFFVNNSPLKEEIERRLELKKKPILVNPNGVDLKRFRPHDKLKSRKHFGFDKDTFLVGSIGRFTEKKGIARVAEAIQGLEGISGVFAGKGPTSPTGLNVSFAGPVGHEDIPKFLSSCDLFVLPTAIEGSCNAIIEAMACGLPIISSVGSFNDDLLDSSHSLRVDPFDVSAIRRAVIELQKSPEQLKAFSKYALKKSIHFDINLRAQRMLRFMSLDHDQSHTSQLEIEVLIETGNKKRREIT